MYIYTLQENGKDAKPQLTLVDMILIPQPPSTRATLSASQKLEEL